MTMANTNGHGPKKAILYARVSTDEQARTGYSLAQQLEALREYAAREGYQVGAVVGGAAQLLWQPGALLLPVAAVAAVVALMAPRHSEPVPPTGE
jgi:hypothetical protein